MNTTPVSRDEYKSSGYAVARNILPTAELQSINEEINELFVLQLRKLGLPAESGASRADFLSNASRLLQADVATYISTARITQMLPSVHRLMLSEPIMKLVTGLDVGFPVISTRASIHIMSDDLKIPNGYHKTPPHQDWRSIQGSLDNIVLWIPTTSVSKNSHALEVVPKSHLLGLLPTSDHIMTQQVDDPRITEDMYVQIPVEPGDVIAFSSFTVHRTGELGDGLARIALSTRFNNAAEKTFVDHGYPSPYSYTYRKDLIFENFPAPSDLETVYARSNN
jgi:ectoine hydroxylase-related dioxygenase (phytanoyl-CoA dioxygenase family)